MSTRSTQMNLLDRDKVGAAAWTYVHAVAQTYPWYPSSSDVTRYRAFITLLGELFTCKVCAGNWMQKLKAHPMTDEVMRDRESLNVWLIDRHNEINLQNGKMLHTFASVSESHWGPQWEAIFKIQKQQEGMSKPSTWISWSRGRTDMGDASNTIFGFRADHLLLGLFTIGVILFAAHRFVGSAMK
jgi:hypothetical protein